MCVLFVIVCFLSHFLLFRTVVFDNLIDVSDDIIYKLDNPRKFIPALRPKQMTLSALDSLPKDLNDKVLGYLDSLDILKMSRVCTRLYYTIHTDEGELACTDTKMQRPIMHVYVLCEKKQRCNRFFIKPANSSRNEGVRETLRTYACCTRLAFISLQRLEGD